jgi:hypothetical protein
VVSPDDESTIGSNALDELNGVIGGWVRRTHSVIENAADATSAKLRKMQIQGTTFLVAMAPASCPDVLPIEKPIYA